MTNMARKRSKATRFVPRLVLGVAVTCVVPACVSGCGPMPGGVAADAFGVADVAFDRGVAPDAFGVADVAFDLGRPDVSVADAAFGDADSGSGDAFSVADAGFSVADTGFGPG